MWVAALTHGHPTGYLAAGVLASVIDALVWGELSLDRALDRALIRLQDQARHEETVRAVNAARRLAAADREPSPEAIATLGEGWVAEQALAIGVYCALVARSFEHGVLLAVNHSGDSDSTGAITGNILGAALGAEAIPPRWLEELELADVIERLCRDWHEMFVSDSGVVLEGNDAWWERYPGW